MPNRYQIVRKLGSGGMADVFLAMATNDGGFEKRVALKRIREELLKEPEARKLFLREAKLGSKLDHPNIVQTFDGGLEGEQLFLVQEFIDGADLNTVLNQMQAGAGRLTPHVVAFLGSQVCQALSFLFGLRDEQGQPLVVAHRDISPGNVLVSRQGAVKLTDFGVVRLEESQTTQGVLRGKWNYFAPEVAKGTVDGRSDLFALGVMLYELATLHHPFDAPSPIERFQRAQVAVAEPHPDLPAQLWQVVSCALSRDPGQRYQTPEQMGAALDAFVFSSSPPTTAHVLARQLEPLMPKTALEPDPEFATAISIRLGQWNPTLEPEPSSPLLMASGPALDASGKLVGADAPAATQSAPLTSSSQLTDPVVPRTPSGIDRSNLPLGMNDGAASTMPKLSEVAKLEIDETKATSVIINSGAAPSAGDGAYVDVDKVGGRSRFRVVLALVLVPILAFGAWMVFKTTSPSLSIPKLPSLTSGDGPMVSIDSIPDGSQVFSGSELLGTTPMLFPNDYKPGEEVKLRVQHAGYAPSEISFTGGQPQRLKVSLKKR